ncbi:MAG: PHP domain-containing protein [Candidatus Coatesbacteria bacterium]|nr:PHP domain-containing protein [Candidatus Coatesbacteria bacterium]
MNDVIFADLHMHSYYSDGELSPIEVYEVALEAGLKAAAITDHDTVEGLIALPQGLLEADLYIPGVEISAFEVNLSCHILGYFHHSRISKLSKILSACLDSRYERIEEMIGRLQKDGIDVSLRELLEDRAPSKLLGRPHLAELMIKKGIVKNKQEAFDEYLSNDSPYYVPYKRMLPKQAIDIIHSVDGIAFLAHPAKDNIDNKIKYLVDTGLDGIEIWHYSHTPAHEEYYLSQARKHNLLVSGGSDFHGYGKINIVGMKGVSEENYWKIIDRIRT